MSEFARIAIPDEVEAARVVLETHLHQRLPECFANLTFAGYGVGSTYKLYLAYRVEGRASKGRKYATLFSVLASEAIRVPEEAAEAELRKAARGVHDLLLSDDAA